jgi:putative transposase
MKKSRYTIEQIIGILKQGEVGAKTADLCREHGDQRSDVVSMEIEVRRHGCSEAQRLRQMENRQLKQLVVT